MGSTNQQILDSELETQIVLRLPEAVAKSVRDSLKQGSSNLRGRLSLTMENDVRHGTLKFDHHILPVKLVDLPCVIESFKTFDRKNVYKTADICQMLVCTTGEEEQEEDPKPQKKKEKDGLVKVEKKYLWPHGVTPPLKNVRKRRFRRTLKKKQYSDQPEIEKEVRRLLRMDYEAHHVSWEVIDEEEDKTKDGGSKDVLMQGSKTNENPSANASRIAVELFGDDALSDSDVEDGDQATEDFESRLSMDDGEDESSRISRMSDSMSFVQQDNENKEKPSGSGLVTSFSKDMFEQGSHPSSSSSAEPSPVKPSGRVEQAVDYELLAKKSNLEDKIRQLRDEWQDITKRREIQENELSTMENMALRQRLESVLRKTIDDQKEKERMIQEVDVELSKLQG